MEKCLSFPLCVNGVMLKYVDKVLLLPPPLLPLHILLHSTPSSSSSPSSSFFFLLARLFLLPPPLFLWLLDPFPGHGLPSRSSSSHSNVFSLCASFSIISNLAPSSHASSFQLPPSETSFHNSLWDSAVEHPCYMPSPPLYVYLHITVPCLDTICRFLHCTVVSTRH